MKGRCNTHGFQIFRCVKCQDDLRAEVEALKQERDELRLELSKTRLSESRYFRALVEAERVPGLHQEKCRIAMNRREGECDEDI